MNRLTAALRHNAAEFAEAIAIDPVIGEPVTYAAFGARVAQLAGTIAARSGSRPIAIECDHGADEALLEAALIEAQVPVLSLPLFFTPPQRRYALAACGAGAIVSGTAASEWVIHPCDPVTLPAGTARITFTSGSTGAPRGICLSAEHMLEVAAAIVEAVGSEHAGRHVALLPPGILLETVGGLFATLLAGGTWVCPPQALAGLANPFSPDFACMAKGIEDWRITSLILVPEYLAGLVAVMEASGLRLPLLTLVAVGGARVAPALLDRARGVGLPVRQGYGLTECASVVTLEAADDPARSAGRPLQHMQVHLADDGEIMLHGPIYLGAIGEQAPQMPLATGDLGRLDAHGRLFVIGRKSNLIITSFGRNIAPEWVEEALLSQPEIAQVFVHGDGLAFPEALLVPAHPEADLAAAVARANDLLPPYARIARWREAAHFNPQNEMLTANGRLRRTVIARVHLDEASNFTELEDATVRERIAFLSIPQVRAGLAGTIGREVYIDYLTQAFHHVSHTVPLMREARARLGNRPDLIEALDDYIAEETGHEEWVLSDIAHAGGNASAARASAPRPATRALVEHAYATIRGGNPVAFFGMVYVLESVSVALASRGAGALAEKLGLPPEAFSYLTSHGALDQSHMAFFARLVNGFGSEDMARVTTMAREIFALFGGMFASIEMAPALALA